jgi:hypothetical protein
MELVLLPFSRIRFSLTRRTNSISPQQAVRSNHSAGANTFFKKRIDQKSISAKLRTFGKIFQL